MGIQLVVDNEAAVKTAEIVVTAAQAKYDAAVDTLERHLCRVALDKAKQRLSWERGGVAARKRAAELGYYS